MTRLCRFLSICLAVAAGSTSRAGCATAAQEHPSADHSAHRKMASDRPTPYTRSLQVYSVPEITLTNQDGEDAVLASLLQSSQPVALNFIFTTCTTICPVMTATFSQMLRELGPDAEDLHMVSVSIDPEYDNPKILKQYADRYKARADWQFLTGESSQIVAVLKAFDAYTGNKMGHRPLTFLKAPGSKDWVRIDGLASGADLAHEYRQLLVE